MTIYVTTPGFYKEPVILPENATVADFCRKAFEQTGLNLFSGFGYKNQDGSSYLVPSEAVITDYIDVTRSGAAQPFFNTPYNTPLKTVFTNGTEILPYLPSASGTIGGTAYNFFGDSFSMADSVSFIDQEGENVITDNFITWQDVLFAGVGSLSSDSTTAALDALIVSKGSQTVPSDSMTVSDAVNAVAT